MIMARLVVTAADVLESIEGSLKAVLKTVNGVEVCTLGVELLQLAT